MRINVRLFCGFKKGNKFECACDLLSRSVSGKAFDVDASRALSIRGFSNIILENIFVFSFKFKIKNTTIVSASVVLGFDFVM
jgi:hypothetical protein